MAYNVFPLAATLFAGAGYLTESGAPNFDGAFLAASYITPDD
jgi:hypothetical protein